MKFSICCTLLAFSALLNDGPSSKVEGFGPSASLVAPRLQQRILVRIYLETKEKTGSDEETTKEKGVSLPFMKSSKNAPSGIEVEPSNNNNDEDPKQSLFPENSLVIVTAILGTISVATQAGAYSDFFQSLSEMKANIADPADFWPAVNFWIFFAVGHAILQPIFWISEVLHASSGPLIGGLVPVTFLVGNIVAIATITLSKEVGYFYANMFSKKGLIALRLTCLDFSVFSDSKCCQCCRFGCFLHICWCRAFWYSRIRGLQSCTRRQLSGESCQRLPSL
jgi:hypothetical protein